MNFISLFILKISPKFKAFLVGTVALIAAGIVALGIYCSKSGNNLDGLVTADATTSAQEVAEPAVNEDVCNQSEDTQIAFLSSSDSTDAPEDTHEVAVETFYESTNKSCCTCWNEAPEPCSLCCWRATWVITCIGPLAAWAKLLYCAYVGA